MASNAEYYSSLYHSGATQLHTELIQQFREEADQTNKSIAERRRELQRVLDNLDGQIASAQRAVESIDTTHFREHVRARSASVRAQSSASRGRGRVSSELEKARVKMRKAVTRSIADAANLAATQDRTYDASTALTSIAREPAVLGVLGEFDIRPDGSGVASRELREAVSLGLEEGLKTGIVQHTRNRPNEDEVFDTVEQIVGVTPPDPDAFERTKSAAASRAVSGARVRGGTSDADIDRYLEESGLGASRERRQQEIAALEERRQAVATEAAGLPSPVTEEDVLAQAAARMGGVGASEIRGRDIISVHRRLKEAQEGVAEAQRSLADRQAQRAAIESMSPSQRILMQSTINSMDLLQRHPRGVPPELEGQALELGGELYAAMQNDPSLVGNHKRLVDMAVHLAEQANPDGDVDAIRSMRDRILDAAAFTAAKTQQASAHVPEFEEPEEGVIGLGVEDFEFRQLTPEELENVEQFELPQLRPWGIRHDPEFQAVMQRVREAGDAFYREESRAIRTGESIDPDIQREYESAREAERELEREWDKKTALRNRIERGFYGFRGPAVGPRGLGAPLRYGLAQAGAYAQSQRTRPEDFEFQSLTPEELLLVEDFQFKGLTPEERLLVEDFEFSPVAPEDISVEEGLDSAQMSDAELTALLLEGAE